MSQESDVFFSAFEPLATNGTRRTTKRRSSILKTDVNYGNEERRASRRISWAQTYQYKEIWADGTAVIKSQDLANKSSSKESIPSIDNQSEPLIEINANNNDENVDKNQIIAETETIKASDFISRLKANSSLINKSVSEVKRKSEELDQNGIEPKKVKRVKRTGKGLTRFLSKHYEIGDQKDYETVCNTSFNKYGRELVPRTEKPDFTQLFNDDEDMSLTKAIELTEVLNQTNRMSVTLNESQLLSSQEDNQTRRFTDGESMAISDNNTQNTSDKDCSVDLPEEEDSQQNSGIEFDDQTKQKTDFNRSFSVYSVESFRRTEREDYTQLFANDMNLSAITEPLHKQKAMNSSQMSLELSAVQSQHSENKTLLFSNEIIADTNEDLSVDENQSLEESRTELKINDTTLLNDSKLEGSITEDEQSVQNQNNDNEKDSINTINESPKVCAVPQTDENQNTTQLFSRNNNDMNLTPISEPSVESDVSMDITNNEEIDVVMSTTQMSSQEVKDKTGSSDMVLTQCRDSSQNKSNDSVMSETSIVESELIAQPLPEQLPKPYEQPEQPSEPIQQQLPEPVSEQLPEPISEQLSKPYEQPSEPIQQQLPEPSSEQLPESSSEQLPEPSSEQLPKPVSVQLPEPISEPVSEQLPEQPILETCEQIPDETNSPQEEPKEMPKEPEICSNGFESKIPKPSIFSRIPKASIQKNIKPIQLSAINKFPKTMNCQQNKPTTKLNLGWLAQTTLQPNQLLEQSLRPIAEQSQTLRIGSQNSTIFRKTERKTIQSTQTLTQTNTEVIETTTTITQISNVGVTPESPVLKVNPLTLNYSIKRPNRQSLTARLEMTKSNVKDMFGLGMTERLKQKRDEIEAKRRQSVVNTAFTPNASNSAIVSDIQTFKSKTNVSQLSTDLFSKSNIEIEDMEVEEQSVPMSESKSKITEEETQSKDDTKCMTTGSESSVDSKKSSKSDSSPESKSESSPESKSSVESESNSESKTSAESKSSNDTESSPDFKSSSESEVIPQSDESLNKTFNIENTDSIEDSSASSSSSSEPCLNLDSTSPLSVSAVHSTDNFLVSSPATIDPTLNFTFDRSDSSDSFDPFVHTNHSFHTSTFYEASNPMQLSFMVREDTLFLLADELERQMQDIVIPIESDGNLIVTEEETTDMFSLLRKLDSKQNGFTIEVLNEEKALISYLWGTFALEIRFGDALEDTDCGFTVRKIVSVNMKSLISAEEPLRIRQNDLILKFKELHKPLITVAHDLIISTFESERQYIVDKHKTSASLHQLVSDISVKVMSAKRLLSELRVISSSEICRLHPKKDDRYRLVVEILGIRKPIYLIIPINPKSYPDEVIRPEIRINIKDKHLYCVKEFSAALLRIESRKFNYIRRLIGATKHFVRANKRLIYEKQKKIKQKFDIKNARLPDSITKCSQLSAH